MSHGRDGEEAGLSYSLVRYNATKHGIDGKAAILNGADAHPLLAARRHLCAVDGGEIGLDLTGQGAKKGARARWRPARRHRRRL